METLTGLLSLSLPFFLLVLLGFAAAKRGIVPTSALGALNAFVLFLALPAMLCMLGRQWAVQGFGGIALLPLYALASLALGLLAWALLRRERDRGARAMAVLVTLFPNTGFLGVPLLGALLGTAASSPLAALIVFDLVVTSSICLFLAGAGSAGLQRALRNPLPWAVGVGVAMGLVDLTLPAPLERTLQLLAQAVSPAALVALGVALAVPPPPQTDAAATARLALLKLVGHPLLAAGLGFVGLQAGWLTVLQWQLLVLAAALPGAANVALLAQHLGHGQHLVPRAILLSTLGAPLTLPVVAWGLGVRA